MTVDSLHGIPPWTRGDRLRKAREKTGLTTREFALEIGVSQKTITNAEGDKPVRRITLIGYAMRCEVPLSWLETGTAPQPKPDGGDGLPRLDSDQEPSGLRISLVGLAA